MCVRWYFYLHWPSIVLFLHFIKAVISICIFVICFHLFIDSKSVMSSFFIVVAVSVVEVQLFASSLLQCLQDFVNTSVYFIIAIIFTYNRITIRIVGVKSHTATTSSVQIYDFCSPIKRKTRYHTYTLTTTYEQYYRYMCEILYFQLFPCVCVQTCQLYCKTIHHTWDVKLIPLPSMVWRCCCLNLLRSVHLSHRKIRFLCVSFVLRCHLAEINAGCFYI
jgi:hypothetical protein